MDLENAYFDNLYSIDFGEVNNRKRPKDQNIEQTAIKIIHNFLLDHPVALLYYICDSSDGRQYSRSRLITKWFITTQESEIDKLTVNYKNEILHYKLEFIFTKQNYQTLELENKVIDEMNGFMEIK